MIVEGDMASKRKNEDGGRRVICKGFSVRYRSNGDYPYFYFVYF